MKKFFALVIAILTAVPVLSAGENLLKTWFPVGQCKKCQRNYNHGVVKFDSPGKLKIGYRQTVVLNQTKPQAIRFGGEVKADKVKSQGYGNYAIYLDIKLKSGKYLWGRCINLPVGTYDWKKFERTLKLKEPIESINYCLRFYKASGEAQLRNVFLEVVE